MTLAGMIFIVFMLAIAGFGLYAASHGENDHTNLKPKKIIITPQGVTTSISK